MLLERCLELLSPALTGAGESGRRAVHVDATLGLGGHAEAVLDQMAKGYKLKKTRNLAAQLTSAEWLQSMPGTPKQKDSVLNCVSCHTVERIVRSTHDPKEFIQVQQRMGTYANQSVPTRIQKRLAERLLEERGDTRNKAQEERAEYMASINLSETESWDYQLKGMARPTGEATQVIITEYDLPRKEIEPHDVIIGKDDEIAAIPGQRVERRLEGSVSILNYTTGLKNRASGSD